MGYLWPDKNSPWCPELVTLPWAWDSLHGHQWLRCAAQHNGTRVLTILRERREELSNRELTWLARIGGSKLPSIASIRVEVKGNFFFLIPSDHRAELGGFFRTL